jgi:hypothetical protein
MEIGAILIIAPCSLARGADCFEVIQHQSILLLGLQIRASPSSTSVCPAVEPFGNRTQTRGRLLCVLSRSPENSILTPFSRSSCPKRCLAFSAINRSKSHFALLVISGASTTLTNGEPLPMIRIFCPSHLIVSPSTALNDAHIINPAISPDICSPSVFPQFAAYAQCVQRQSHPCGTSIAGLC